VELARNALPFFGYRRCGTLQPLCCLFFHH
jgi:hypothetical protein